MKKLLKRYGDAYVIRLTAEEREIYNLDEGDELDVEICKVKKRSNKK